MMGAAPRLAALAVAVLSLGAASSARAAPALSPVVDSVHQYQLELAPEFPPSATGNGAAPAEPGYDGAGTGAGLVALWRSSRGAVASVSRIDGPSVEARLRNNDFAEQFEAGLRRHARGYRRLDRAQSSAQGVPVLDLEYTYRAAGGAAVRVLSRTLFFRRYALTLSVSTAARRAPRIRRSARRMVRSFAPHLAE